MGHSVRFGSKTCVSLSFLCLGNEFSMSMSYHIITTGCTVVFLLNVLTSWKTAKNWHFFVFIGLQIHIKRKVFTCISQCGLLVKSSRLSPALLVLSEVRVPRVSNSFILFSFNFELVYRLPAFRC